MTDDDAFYLAWDVHSLLADGMAPDVTANGIAAQIGGLRMGFTGDWVVAGTIARLVQVEKAMTFLEVADLPALLDTLKDRSFRATATGVWHRIGDEWMHTYPPNNWSDSGRMDCEPGPILMRLFDEDEPRGRV